MDLYKIILNIIFSGFVNSLVIKSSEESFDQTVDNNKKIYENPDNVFNGVYSECFLHLSYSCLQKKTLLYLKELNNLSEVSVIGDYVKFVKINSTNLPDEDDSNTGSTDELAFMIDKAVDDFFDNHVLKFNALGRDISIPRNMEEFVGRKKRKGGGGGGGMMMGGHGGGHDDGGKKKMMMMAMMCMKMKLMMMVPAMMGMMGMMSFKGMMFSMMSFMLSKMMLLMKILEKKGGAGGLGGGGGGGDGSWAAGGGGGGAWMPAGGQDFGGGGSGGGGGGYDANGQWQSRSIAESLENINKPTLYHRGFIDKNLKRLSKSPYSSNNDDTKLIGRLSYHTSGMKHLDYGNKPEVSYMKPAVRLNNKIETEVFKKPVLVYKKSNVDFNYGQEPKNLIDSIKNDYELISSDLHSRVRRRTIDNLKDRINVNQKYITKSDTDFKTENKISYPRETENKAGEKRSRKKRSILDLLQNSYMYWMNRLLGLNNNRRTNLQKYKIINGVRYVYYPFKSQRPKMPKEVQLLSTVKLADELKPVLIAEDFNKGEIMEGAVESRMNKKKFHKMKDTVNDTMEDNPWE